MGIDKTILVYTHTDMEDVWGMFFDSLKKYLPDYKTYVAVNRQALSLPAEYIQLYYTDTLPYTDRLQEVLSQVEEEVVLFIHEDMPLYDEPDLVLLEKFTSYVAEGLADSIKLISVGTVFNSTDLDPLLAENDFAKFSIQPTLLKKSYLQTLLKLAGSKNIWEFEAVVEKGSKDYMVRLGSEKKRGLYHYDSLVFPYIATAITKGRWNYSEYPDELGELLLRYRIDYTKRGMV